MGCGTTHLPYGHQCGVESRPGRSAHLRPVISNDRVGVLGRVLRGRQGELARRAIGLRNGVLDRLGHALGAVEAHVAAVRDGQHLAAELALGAVEHRVFSTASGHRTHLSFKEGAVAARRSLARIVRVARAGAVRVAGETGWEAVPGRSGLREARNGIVGDRPGQDDFEAASRVRPERDRSAAGEEVASLLYKNGLGGQGDVGGVREDERALAVHVDVSHAHRAGDGEAAILDDAGLLGRARERLHGAVAGRQHRCVAVAPGGQGTGSVLTAENRSRPKQDGAAGVVGAEGADRGQRQPEKEQAHAR